MRIRYISLTLLTGVLFSLLVFIAANAQSNELNESVTKQAENPEAFRYSNVDVVVQFGIGEDVVRGIYITEPISGIDALLATDLEIVTEDFGEYGVAVCAINGVGCTPPDPCFCQTDSWNYRKWVDDEWQDPGEGASFTNVNIGDVEGWRWGVWDDPESLPPAPKMVSISNALDWLKLKQNTTNGGYGSMSSSAEVLLAIGSNGNPAADWRQQSFTVPLSEYIITNSPSYARKTAAEAGKLASGIAATGLCWSPVSLTPMEYYSPTTGAYSIESGFNAWAILGAISMGETVPISALNTLKDQVQPDGGWEWNTGFSSDTNTTALVIQVLIASGELPDSLLIQDALTFLKTAQNDDGGFPYDPDSIYGTDSDTNSTSYVTQAIYAVGQDPITGTWVISGTNPIEYLNGMQLENGNFEWMPGYGENLVATTQAIPALLGKFLPYQVTGVEGCPSIFLTDIRKGEEK